MTVGVESRFIDMTLQYLFAQAMVGSRNEGRRIEDQGIYAVQSYLNLFIALIVTGVSL